MSLLGALRKAALAYPEAEEGIACKGTALETRTVRAGKKAFVFLAAEQMRVKLGDSYPEAVRLASNDPERFGAGAHGWVQATISDGDAASLARLVRWIDESYRLLAPKALVASLPAASASGASPSPPTREVASRKAAKARR